MIEVYYLIQRAEEMPADESWLAPGEIAYMSGLRIKKRRDDWLLGRWTAKQALCSFLSGSLSKDRIEICRKENGAPEVLLDGKASQIALSLSHRDNRSLCALSPDGCALGADIELVEPHSDTFVEDYFTDNEKQMIARSAEADRFTMIALLWSAKESALKALQVGLSVDTRDVEVLDLEFKSTPGWHPLSVRGVHKESLFRGWWMRDELSIFTVASDPPSNIPVYLDEEIATE
jgi:4'-phosphopantetheinyl transferase